MTAALALVALSALALVAAWALMLSGFGRPEAPDARVAPPRAPAGPARQDEAAVGETATPGTMDMAEFKRLVQAGAWRRVLPSLLLIGGMLGIMFFGAIALLFVLEQKVTGVLMLLVPVAAAAKLAWDFRNA
jgi:hypothetical protein